MSISFIRISKTPRIQLKDYITRVAKRDVEISDEEKKFIDNYEIKSNILFEKQDYLELTKLSFSLRDKYPNDIKINQFVIGLTVYMINELTDKKVQTDIVELFLQDLSSRTSIDFNTRLKTLTNLFNSLQKSNPLQLNIFLNIVELSASNGQIHLLYSNFSNIDELSSDWNITGSEKRQMFYSIIVRLGKNSAINQIRTDLTIKYINTFEKVEAEGNEIKELNEIVASLLNFGYAVFEHRNVLNSKGAAIIEKNNKHLYEAFRCYVKGDLEGYFTYEEQNKNFVEGLGINKAEFEKKVRVFYISQFTEPGTSIQYGEFAQILKIKEQEVEYWVFLAINSGIIDAQLDQYNQTIFLKNNQGKYFDLEEWKKLDVNLQKLIKKLDSYLGNPN